MLDNIGKYGPLVLILLTVVLLFNKKVFLMYYLIGLFVNTVINIILKGLIRDPRPSGDTVTRTPFDKYGMPSGHSQSVGFSLCYIWFTLYSPVVFVLYAIISVLTMYQRYKYNCHTIPQIIIGYITGIVIGVLFIYIALYKIKGKIHCKQDDGFVL